MAVVEDVTIGAVGAAFVIDIVLFVVDDVVVVFIVFIVVDDDVVVVFTDNILTVAVGAVAVIDKGLPVLDKPL